MRKKLIIFIMPVLIFSGMICATGVDYGRTIDDGKLSDSGHSWAGFKERCADDNFILEFNLSNLTGGVQANLNLDINNRYAIGFINLENGSLATYLYREEKENIEHHPGLTVDFNPLAIYQVEISSAEGEVKVFIEELPDSRAIKVIDYLDANPLPAGAIDFETLENSSANMSNVILKCELPADLESNDQEPPNLGVGYFKPPE